TPPSLALVFSHPLVPAGFAAGSVSRCGTSNRLPPHRQPSLCILQLKYRARCIKSGQVVHGGRIWL
ncbi:hypothetical protein PoMZ_07693, partial [Pyricularia oryzae]